MRFCVPGVAGQQVTITMTSTQFDTYLFLIQPDGSSVAAQDDDGGGGTNSRIDFALTSTGTWFIGANSFFPNEAGSYSMMLVCLGGPAPTATPTVPGTVISTPTASRTATRTTTPTVSPIAAPTQIPTLSPTVLLVLAFALGSIALAILRRA